MAGKKKESRSEKYGRELLVGQAEALFGVKPETAAGALHDRHGAEFTLDEARSFVSQFMKRKVM
ncbi:hypothetical protein [Cohnella caldifontis]|uniref:hypothetical protein n=1 Tax=Cohnella caldifontis TaxID=3027471 RepID=UPI0023EC204F|nr:hypothetical protein [Cohnella sp. YIM B05605]